MPEPEVTPALDSFLDRALPRLQGFMLVLAAIGVLFCVAFFHWQVTAGFIAGALISYVNQRWLERGIEALGERITSQQSRERGGVIVLRVVLRYILVAGGAYVIFNVSHAALYGFLGGICLPIAAIACEVAVEIVVILRRKT